MAERITVRLPEPLVASLDRRVAEGRHANRSAAVRAAIAATDREPPALERREARLEVARIGGDP